MKLASPKTIAITEQRVLDVPQVDLEQGRMVVPVGLVTSDGMVIKRNLVLMRPRKRTVLKDVATKVGDHDNPETVMVPTPTVVVEAPCQRIGFSGRAQFLEEVVSVETFENEQAFENARSAMKEDNEIAALEVAGVVDGWLLPATN